VRAENAWAHAAAHAAIAVVQRAIARLAEGASVERAAAAEEKPAIVPVVTAPAGSAEDRCRRAWRSGMIPKQLMTAAKVSESTAKRWRAKFMDEETLIGVAARPTKRLPVPIRASR
jgi:hypothetical protein